MTRKVYPQSLKGDYIWMIVGDFNCPLIVYSTYSTMPMYAFVIKNKIK